MRKHICKGSMCCNCISVFLYNMLKRKGWFLDKMSEVVDEAHHSEIRKGHSSTSISFGCKSQHLHLIEIDLFFFLLPLAIWHLPPETLQTTPTLQAHICCTPAQSRRMAIATGWDSAEWVKSSLPKVPWKTKCHTILCLLLCFECTLICSFNFQLLKYDLFSSKLLRQTKIAEVLFVTNLILLVKTTLSQAFLYCFFFLLFFLEKKKKKFYKACECHECPVWYSTWHRYESYFFSQRKYGKRCPLYD